MTSNENKPNEVEKLKDHSYDGIEELDNSLPNWWLNGFYLTILFALGYFYYYSVGDGPTLVREYERSVAESEYHQYLHKAPVKTPTEEEFRAFLKDPVRLKMGKEVFSSKCVSCHGKLGEGGIGPNLTDDYWIHGGKMVEIYKTVSSGVLDKGMPAWGQMMKQEEVYAVVAFVKSLRGTRPPNAKQSQGVLVKE